jgi:ethanolamine transporter EutH
VLAEINGQIGYHASNAKRMHNLDHRLHSYGQLILGSTLGVAILFFILVGAGVLNHEDHTFLHVFTLFGALLPTVGAALGAIHVQGDFRTVSEQSQRTKKRLEALVAILDNDPLSFALLADRAERASDIMMADLLEWQTIFRTRPLAPPA